MNDFIIGGGAMGITKGIVDVVKLAVPTIKSWQIVLLAFIIGPLMAVLFMIGSGDQNLYTPTTWANTLIAGFTAAIGATGLSNLHNRAESKREKVTALSNSDELGV